MSLRLENIRHLPLDRDGTIFKGRTLFDFTKPFRQRLNRLGIGLTLLTNNSCRNACDYLNKLKTLGLQVQLNQIYTAGIGTIEYLRAHHPEHQRLFILGTQSLRAEFVKAGFERIQNSDQAEPQTAIVAFDSKLGFQRLCKAGYWIKQGLPFIATHPDLVCLTDQRTLLDDCSAKTACLSAATSRWPNVNLGNLTPSFLREFCAVTT